MKRLLAAALALPLLLGAGAPSQTGAATGAVPSAFDLYAAGKYDDAIAAGLSQNNAQGFVIAARAALAGAQMRDAPCLDCLQRAEGFARRAIAADASVPEGHIYLAVTLGYEARIVGVVQARMKGYAEEAKRELDKALALDPRNPWGLAALAGWNIEIVHHGGTLMAKLLYGASVDEGMSDFAKAFSAQPGNLVLRFQEALTLSGFDLDGYRGTIEDALAQAANGTPVTAYDRAVRGRAVSLLKLLKAHDDGTFLVLVRKYQGYPE